MPSLALYVYLTLPFLGATLILFSASILRANWLRIRVFVSYFHENVDIARLISDELSRNNYSVHMIPFRDADYDEIINEVRSNLMRCHIVLVIPGPERSFVDAEVLAASVLRRPLVFVSTATSALPDTALSGYPVVSSAAISGNNLHLISRFLRFIKPRLFDEIFFIFGSLESFMHRALNISLAMIPIGIVLAFLDTSFIWSLGPDRTPWLSLYHEAGISAVWMFSLTITWTLHLLKSMQVARIVRQEIAGRETTYAQLERALKGHRTGKKVLGILRQEPMRRRLTVG